MSPPEPRPFAEPWHAQAFALAVALNARGLFSWSEWTQALGAGIARAPHREYYECWLEALEGLLARKGVASRADLAALAEAWKAAAHATPHGKPIELKRRGGGS